MAAYAAGDAIAFEELHDRLAPWLQRMVQQHMRKPEEARDLVQQTFLQLHRARHDFREGARLRPWVATIALNLRRGYYRRSSVRRERHLKDPENGGPQIVNGRASSNPERTAEAAKVRQALETLTESQREVLVLHFHGGFTYREISEMTGVGLSAVKLRAHRAYAALRARIGGEA